MFPTETQLAKNQKQFFTHKMNCISLKEPVTKSAHQVH